MFDKFGNFDSAEELNRAAAAQLILEEKYGYMVGFKNDDIVPVPLEEVAGRLKMVDPEASIIKEAKSMGISFGTKE